MVDSSERKRKVSSGNWMKNSFFDNAVWESKPKNAVDVSTSKQSDDSGEKLKNPSANLKELWTDLYSPKTSQDLAVNSKKLSSVKEWLVSASYVNGATPSILLLTGPTGVGKSTLIKVLCKESKIDLVKCSLAQNHSTLTNFEESEYSFAKFDKCKNCSENYLRQVSRYLPVVNFNAAKKRILMVEEFPPNFKQNHLETQDAIQKFSQMSKFPIVYVFTDNEDSPEKSELRNIFTASLLEVLEVRVINIGSVPNTIAVKALNRIVNLARSDGVLSFQPSKEKLNEIYAENMGNIKAMINQLNFEALGGRGYVASVKGNDNDRKKSYKSVQKNKKLKRSENNKKLVNERAGLMRSVARSLYAKRQSSEVCLDSRFKVDPRGELVHTPESIVHQYSDLAKPFIDMTFENYLDIFSDINAVSSAVESVSCSDLILSEWRDKDLTADLGLMVAVQGLMYYNVNPQYKWNPVRAFKGNKVSKAGKDNMTKVKDLILEFNCSPKGLVTDIIPYLKLINPNSDHNFVEQKFSN